MYDLTVADEHVFYANGVLVSNCADALQYLCLHYNAQLDSATSMWKTKARTVVTRPYTFV